MQPLPLSHPGHPGELVLLAAERTVTVTFEEHHQDVLAGRTGPAIAELRPCRIVAGKHAGQDGLEVTLDGRRVGELSRLMAQRYRPMVDAVRVSGYRAGCEAVLRADARGIQVELRLPADHGRPTTDPPTIPARRGASRWPGRVPHAAARQRRRPPAPASLGVPTPRPTGRRRFRRLFGVTAAVVGVLVLASALGDGSQEEMPTSSSSALPTAVAAPEMPAPVEPTPETTSPETTSAVPVAEPVDEPDVAPTGRSTAKARPPSPTTSKPATSKPAPRTVEAAPEPAPEQKSEPEPSDCDPSYSGCVPIARDVDCEGGSGDGPAYVAGPVRVIGTDIYGLDRGGEPGIGCE